MKEDRERAHTQPSFLIMLVTAFVPTASKR